MPAAHHRHLTRLLCACACIAIVLAGVVLPSARWGPLTTQAQPTPVRMDTVYVTSGLTWEIISKHTTPHLACFAERSAVAAMALTSGSVLTTKRQGLESLVTGERTAPQQPGVLAAASVPAFLADGHVRVIDLGDVTSPESARELDARFAAVAGECGAAHAYGSGSRAAVASLGHTNPAARAAATVENERNLAHLDVPLNLQVYIDSGWAHSYLTSPSTRQAGMILNVDVAAAAHGQHSRGIGRDIAATPAAAGAAVERAWTLGTGARSLNDALPAVAAAIAVLLLAATTATLTARRRLQRIAVSALATSPLCIAAALIVPTPAAMPSALRRAAHHLAGDAAPGLLTTGALLATTGLLAFLLLIATGALTARCAPTPTIPPLPLAASASALLTTAAACLDAVLGSHAQLLSLVGNQPLYAGRFYGFGNLLVGLLLATWIIGCGALIHCLSIFTSAPRAARSRIILISVTGVLLAGIAISPSMGADAGSALVFLPATLLGALVVSERRVRGTHLALAAGAGIAMFTTVGILDSLRPEDSRTHLGAFVAHVVDEGRRHGVTAGISAFTDTFVERTARMLEPLWVFPLWVTAPALASIALTLYLWWKPGVIARSYPHVHRLRAVGLIAALAGTFTNDTGLALLIAYLAAGSVISGALAHSAPRQAHPPHLNSASSATQAALHRAQEDHAAKGDGAQQVPS